uniref:Uncharacterized protein n=1 Tax=mine drainage metagenome TaxID=410659 RepID=E6QA18_9ZZZZ
MAKVSKETYLPYRLYALSCLAQSSLLFSGDQPEDSNPITGRDQDISCRLSEMESGVGWGRKVDYRDETLLSGT